MKSMLHEASSVTKAIEKAWADSGKPREFTINVLEPGVKNFFGFCKLPAIVSITFDPKSVPVVRQDNNDRRDPRQQQKQRSVAGRDEQKRRDPRDQRERSERTDRNDKDRQARPQTRSEQPLSPQRIQQAQEPRVRPEQRDSQRDNTRTEQRDQVREPRDHEDLVAWTPELTADLHTETTDLVKVIGITIPYTITTDKRNAHVAFAAGILPAVDDERQLFMSMSYLLIQFLKKKHKKKLRGFHITVTTNRHDASQQNSSDS